MSWCGIFHSINRNGMSFVAIILDNKSRVTLVDHLKKITMRSVFFLRLNDAINSTGLACDRFFFFKIINWLSSVLWLRLFNNVFDRLSIILLNANTYWKVILWATINLLLADYFKFSGKFSQSNSRSEKKYSYLNMKQFQLPSLSPAPPRMLQWAVIFYCCRCLSI